MRNIANWPANTDATEPVVTVRHGGKDRPINSLTLSRTLPSSLHAQVARVGGLVQATGTVEWADQDDVTTAAPTAFNRKGDWPPRVRDTVEVHTGYRTLTGDAIARQLTGFIASSSGDPMRSSESGLVDPISRLSQKITLPPLQREMPPLEMGGLWRGLGLYPTFYTDRFARAGRFYSTPGMASGCVFSAPLMGSTWPERGTLTRSVRFTDNNLASAGWKETPWGMGASDITTTYAPSGDSRLVLGRAMEITAMRPTTGYSGRAYVAAFWGTDDIWMSFNGNTIYAMHNSTIITSFPYVDGNVFTLRATPTGGTGLTLSLRDEAGREVNGATTLPAGSGSNMTEIRVVSELDTATIGGVQVSFPSNSAWSSVNYTRSAFITPAAHNTTLDASPPIENVPARDLLEEQATAEMAALWIDGDGHLHWVNRDRLQSGAPVTTLTTRDHLKDLRWREDFSGVASSVEVTGRKVGARLLSKHYNHEVWRSSYSGVEADGTESFEELIHPGSDEDWIQVDTSFAGTDTDRNRMRRSDMGLYYFIATGTEGQAGYSAGEGINELWASAGVTRIDDRTYRVNTYVHGVTQTSADEYVFSLKVPSERRIKTATPWNANLGGMNFPIIRAMAKTMWEDVTYTANAGAWDAPVLTHDVGWWVQHPTAVQNIANLIATRTTTPQPILDGVGIVPDARLERGDIVLLQDPEITGVQFTALVVGIEDRFTSNPIEWEQSCDFRVLDYTTINPSLSDLDTAWAGELLAALDAARAGDTLTQFDTTPLEGAPA